MRVVPHLFYSMGNTLYVDSQRQAAVALAVSTQTIYSGWGRVGKKRRNCLNVGGGGASLIPRPSSSALIPSNVTLSHYYTK